MVRIRHHIAGSASHHSSLWLSMLGHPTQFTYVAFELGDFLQRLAIVLPGCLTTAVLQCPSQIRDEMRWHNGLVAVGYVCLEDPQRGRTEFGMTFGIADETFSVEAVWRLFVTAFAVMILLERAFEVWCWGCGGRPPPKCFPYFIIGFADPARNVWIESQGDFQISAPLAKTLRFGS